jgi:hypothetical protein
MMLKIFAKHYPELVDKNNIKYPIEDKLIKKMALLHGAEEFPEKPVPKKVSLQGQRFENLLYVWEFCNNFSDFLKCREFKMEDLQAALQYDKKPSEVNIYDEENIEKLTWEQRVT